MKITQLSRLRNKKTELQESYLEWRNFAEKLSKNPLMGEEYSIIPLQVADELYCKAMILTQGIETDSCNAMDLALDDKLQMWQGIYLTALLNNKCLEELIVDVSGISFIGYRLSRGKIRIKANCEKYTGSNATGGIMLNEAIIYGPFGENASGESVLINDNNVLEMGSNANLNSLFVNNHRCIKLGFRGNAKYVNAGIVDEMSISAMGGFSLNTENGFLHNFANHTLEGIYVDNGIVEGHMGLKSNGLFIVSKLQGISFMQDAHKKSKVIYRNNDDCRYNIAKIQKDKDLSAYAADVRASLESITLPFKRLYLENTGSLN